MVVAGVMDLLVVSEEEEWHPVITGFLHVFFFVVVMNFCMIDPKDLKYKFTLN